MNKTFKEFIILISICLISIGISIGIYYLYKSFSKNNLRHTNNKMSLELEKKLKNLIKDQINLDSKILYNKNLNIAFNKIKDHLSANLEDNSFDIEVIVIDSDIINAGALPGGLIIIYSGLIKASDNPKEIACVLAHEMGHVIHRDSMQAIIRQFSMTIIFAVISGNDSTTINRIIKSIIDNQFTRDQEQKADEYAYELMIKSGINPINYANILKKLKAKESSVVDKKLLKYISTHPLVDDRIKEAEHMSKLFRGTEYKFNINWKSIKKELPSVFEE